MAATSNPNDPTFYLSITHEPDGTPNLAQITTKFAGSPFATREEAKAHAATYPKAMAMKATQCGGLDENENYRTVGMIRGTAYLTKNGVNGGVNETGINRVRRWVRDLNIAYETRFGNSYDTLDDALAALDEQMEG